MSTLKETIVLRRAAESPSEIGCYSTDASVPALLIHAGPGEVWILPWSHFASGRYTANGSREQLTLLFAHHEVALHGTCLGSLLPEIAGFRLESLRSLPAKYEPQGNASEPFIEHLSVRPMGPQPPIETAPSSQTKTVSPNDDFP